MSYVLEWKYNFIAKKDSRYTYLDEYWKYPIGRGGGGRDITPFPYPPL